MISGNKEASVLHKLHRFRIPVVVFCITAMLTGGAWVASHRWLEVKDELRFSRSVDQVTTALSSAINIYTYGLGGANGVFAASEHVEKLEFRHYVESRDLEAEFPGAFGFGYAQHVPRSDLEGFLTEATMEHRGQFKLQTTGDQPELFVVKYVEPEAANVESLGFDIASDPVRREAAALAMRTGKPTLTRHVILRQDEAKRSGFLYLRPVYKRNYPVSTESERLAAIDGWVFVPFTVDTAVAKVKAAYGDHVAFTIFEGTDIIPDNQLYTSSEATVTGVSGLTQTRVLTLGQQEWSVRVTPQKAFFTSDSSRYLPTMLLLLGMLASVMAAIVTWTVLRAREKAFTDELEESSALRRGVLDSADYLIIITDQEGTIKIFNPAASKLLGYDPEEIIGKHTPAFFHEKTEMALRGAQAEKVLGRPARTDFEALIAGVASGEVEERETYYVRKDGTRVPLFLSVTAIRDTRDHLIGYMGIGHDISERKRAEADLQQSEERFRNSFNYASHGMALVSIDGRWMKVNQSLCQMVGWSEEELLSMTFSDVTHPEDIETSRYLTKEILEGRKQSYQKEKRYIHKDGHIVWIMLSVSLVRDAAGNPLHFVSQIQDISEAKKFQDELKQLNAQLEKRVEIRTSQLEQSEKRFRFLADAMPQIVWTTTPEGRVDYVNKRWVEYTGEPGLDESWTKLIHPDDQAAVRERWRQSVASGQGFETEYRLHRKHDGAYRWHLARAVPFYNESGSVLMWAGTCIDIEDYKQAQQSLIGTNEDLERKVEERTAQLQLANRSKSQFLANMSHEIRTPLTSIIGFSETMIAESLSEEERLDALSTILRNGQHLLHVINDILDLSKIEAGKLDVEILPVNTFDLISDVSNLMQHKAEEKGIAFGFNYLYPIPKYFKSDITRVKQILLNLISNAIKFTDQGGVKVLLSYIKEDNLISFKVCDTGIGISADDQRKLFQAFSQADTSTTRKFGGTGLGLIISAQLAKSLGGNISVESNAGCGSIFTVTLDCGELPNDIFLSELPLPAKVTRVEIATIPVADIAGSILIAEDGPDNRGFIAFLLKKTKIRMTFVENGALAIDQVRSNNYDLILMDMQMPVMDGYTATQTIRAMGINTPVIAITANIMTNDVERALTAGCDGHLGKPFQRKDFYQIIRKHLRPKNADTKSRETAILESDDNDPEFLKIVLAMTENLPRRVRDIEAACNANDFDEIAGLSHKLCGAASFYYPHIYTLAKRLEQLALEKRCAELPATLSELNDEIMTIYRRRTQIQERINSTPN